MVGPQARKALRLVEALRIEGGIPVVTWDESGTTQAVTRGGDRDPLVDARAAAALLQDFLDARAA
jgi:RNase H-fold protein (predicted Holliday junction resolvase)